MPRLIHKEANAEHLLRLKNLIGLRIRAGGICGADSSLIIEELRRLVDPSGNRFYTDYEIQQAMNELIGKGEVKHK